MSVQRSTFPSYAGIVRKHLLPALGGIRLDKLEPTTVQRLYQRFLDAGAAAATVRLRHVVLHKALDQAVAWPTVARNVAEGAKLPSGNEFEADAWSADEVRAFLAATDKDPRRVLWRLGFDSGMRLCELLALGWSDVDLEGGTVSVRRKLVRGAIGGWEIKEGAKSKAGRRTIVLLPDTVAALRGHRAAQNERRLRLGADWRDLGVVIDRGDGDHERPGAIQQALARAVERAGLPPLTPHGMRHTMATVMAAAGVHPSVVQARLGHSSPEITLARYTHVSADMQRDGADQLARILAGSPDAAVRSA